MKKVFAIVTLSILGMGIVCTSQAGDAVAGKSKAISCVGCHGADGISPINIIPNLAGQQELYLVKAIKDFRNGFRTDPLMGPMVQSLSDADIENLAAHFTSLKRFTASPD